MIGFYLNLYRLVKAIVRSWNDRMFRGALTLATMLLLSGALFYHRVEGWSWVDAFYFSATTMSTVGYGDLAPATDVGKIFTVFYILVGVGVFVALFAKFTEALLRDFKEIEAEDET